MTPDPATHWARVQELFHAALERPEADRRAFLDEACGDDAALRDEVWSLLVEDARDNPLLDHGAAAVAPAVLEEEDEVQAIRHRNFGPYRVLGLLGRGGMGVVYLAKRDDLDRVVAVKVLEHAWLSPARRERFADEQRVLSQLVHPGIARLYDADVLADGTPWFAMEYVEGRPITDYCRVHAPTLDARLALVAEVGAAVAHAHQHLVVHRDLKPSNILVSRDGRVKLLDFGISKQLPAPEDGAAGAPDPTLTALRLFTPAYASPEQLGGQRVGVQTDVYSLGVVLYELVAGHRPFGAAGQTSSEVEAAVLAGDPPRPSGSPGRVAASRAAWADVDVLCLTALQADPARRYASVDAFVRDVERFRAGLPLEARPDALSYRAGKFIRRRWRGLSAAAAVAALVVGLVAFYTWRLAGEQAAAEAEAARSARIEAFMTRLFEGGDAAAGPAEGLLVTTLIDRGAQEAAALEADPAVQAELYRTLGTLQQKLGRFAEADRLLERAREGLGRAGGGTDAQMAATLVAVGLLRLDQARLDEAERVVREGLDRSRRLGDTHPAVARATAALGRVLEARGDTEGAIAAGESAVRLFAAAPGAEADHAQALSHLADAHFYAGHYEESDTLNQQVLAAVGRLYGARHPRVADVLINLGASQVDRGRYSEAETFYRPALDILREFHGANHFRTASAETMLGRALVYQKRFDEGVPLLAHALTVQELVNGPAHPRVASALNDLGSAALQQGRLDEADARFRRMVEVYRQVYGAEHYLVGIATSNLGSVQLERQDFVAAETLLREAVGLYTRTQGAGHLNTGIGRIKLGRALVRQRRHAEAEAELTAGYAIVKAQATPGVSWLVSARADLVEVYTALGQPGRADAIRAEAGTFPSVP